MRARTVGIAFSMVILAAGAAEAQNPLAQLGIAEPRARELAHNAITGSGRSAGYADQGMRKLFLAMPGPARGALTTAMWAWTKTYLSSPAYATAYAKTRADATPQAKTFKGTVDEELKAKVDEQSKSLADSRKNIAQMPAETRKAMEVVLKQQDSMLKATEYLKMMRMVVEQERIQARARDSTAMKRWRDEYPEDSQVLIARRLREFMAMCADVDFAARTQLVDDKKVFVNAAYEKKSAEWKECYRAGRESVTAARSAATAWLTQLGPAR